jgi:6-phosphogluconolactonase
LAQSPTDHLTVLSHFNLPNVAVQVLPGAREIAEAAALDWLKVLQSPVRPVACALSGGRIASTFFSALVAALAPHPQLLDRVHFFWADERCVPPDDPESNFASAQKLLLLPLRIPAARIHRLRGELPPDTAATLASSDLEEAFPRGSSRFPELDLVFLGMGEDGHIASLFPGTQPDNSGHTLYSAVTSTTKLPRERITLSYEMLFAAKRLAVLVTGAEKADVLRSSLNGADTPLGYVLRECRDATIYTDLKVT